MQRFPYFLVGFLGLVGMAVGRMACGWLCPFGFLQDLMKRISRRVVKLPRWMGHLKYVSLVVLAILLPFFLGDDWVSKLCPAGGVEGAIPWVVMPTSDSSSLGGMDVRAAIGVLFWVKMTILAAFLIGMVFIKRPFCRTGCPLGAIFSLFNRLSLVRLRFDPAKCTECGICERLCPVDLKAHWELDSPECIKCLECTKCPTGAISVHVGFGRAGAGRARAGSR
jgi:polyferredoxin